MVIYFDKQATEFLNAEEIKYKEVEFRIEFAHLTYDINSFLEIES